MDKRNSEKKSRFSINEDYLEFLSNTNTGDEYEDVYSDSSKDEYEDIYSNSCDDIYVGKKSTNDDGVYISRGRRSQPQMVRGNYYSQTAETPRVQTRYQKIDVYDDDEDEDEVSDYESRRRKKKHPFLKAIAIILVIAMIGVAGVYMLAKSTVSSITNNFVKAEEIVHINEESLVTETYVRNILLVGCDKANGGSSRSDSMMLVSVNTETGKVTVISILRDIHVEIPGERKSKINHAHSWGGVNLLIQTIEHNFGIRIDDYAAINFEMFEAVIDELGGVTVDLTEAEANHMNNYFKLGQNGKSDKVYAGEDVELDGYQALCYARIRKIDSDFNRTERQRNIVSSVANSLKGKSVDELMDLAQDIAPYVETTLTDDVIMSLITSMAPSLVSNVGDENSNFIVSSQIPFDNTWEYDSDSLDGSIISIDLEENKDILYQILYEGKSIEEFTEE